MTPAAQALREALRADARTHIGRLAAPVWTPPKPVNKDAIPVLPVPIR